MKFIITLLVLFFAVLTWSAINPKDFFTWVLEVMPAIIALFVMAFTYKRFKLSSLLYVLILIHSWILMVGGHYTYAEVPLFDLIRDVFEQTRNNYDKVGHLAQGFVPAILIREILIRKSVINGKKWLNFIIVTMTMSISVAYEFLEWFVAELSGESADAFLGSQGYIWDTQSDMLFATFGAILALLTLSKVHDKLIKDL